MEEQKMFSLCLNFVIRIFARMRAVSVIDFSFATTMHILLPLNADSFFLFWRFFRRILLNYNVNYHKIWNKKDFLAKNCSISRVQESALVNVLLGNHSASFDPIFSTMFVFCARDEKKQHIDRLPQGGRIHRLCQQINENDINNNNNKQNEIDVMISERAFFFSFVRNEFHCIPFRRLIPSLIQMNSSRLLIRLLSSSSLAYGARV